MEKKHGKLIGAVTAFLFTGDEKILKPFKDSFGETEQ
jgi:hypothetical protein